MKISNLVIRNYKQFKKLELDHWDMKKKVSH
jgi:predicted ATPase